MRRGGAEHDLDDPPELPIRPRPRQHPPRLPGLDRGADVLHLVDRERIRDGLLPVEPGDMVHRVTRQDLVADREREGEAEDDAGVLGTAIAASGELLEEVVAAGDPDLPEGEVFECGKDEALRAAFDDAVTNGALATNPLVKVKRPAVKKIEVVKALSVEQAQRLVKAANAPAKFRPVDEVPRFGRAVRLLLLTGLRRGELLALRWQNIDLDRAEATVRGSLQRQNGALVVAPPKTTGSKRTIALSPSAVALFKDHRTVQVAERLKAANVWHDGDFIFTTANGEPCDPRNLLRAVEKAAESANLPDWVGGHTLRHTFATQSLLNGVPLHVVSRSLGHSSIAITADTYGHLTDDAAASAVAKVAEALGV